MLATYFNQNKSTQVGRGSAPAEHDGGEGIGFSFLKIDFHGDDDCQFILIFWKDNSLRAALSRDVLNWLNIKIYVIISETKQSI